MGGFGIGFRRATTTAAAGGSDSIELATLVDEVAPQTVYINEPAAVYDPATDRTFVAYLGLERDLYVTYWDHQTGEVATPVEVGTYPLPDNDNHGAPSIEIDLDGYIHVVWGGHGTVANLRHSRTDSPRDISAWTTQTLNAGTYSQIKCDPASGNLYLLYRANTGTSDGHGSTFPAEEFCGMQKSSDNGANWSTAAGIIDATGAPEAKADVYLNGAAFADDGLLYILWVLARGATHDDTRQGVYVATLDPTDDTLAAVDGTDLGSAITWAEHSSCEVTSGVANNAAFVVDGTRIVVSWSADNGATHRDAYVGVWDGSDWTVADTGIDQPPTVSYTAPWIVAGAVRLAAPTLNGSVGDLVIYGSTDGSTDWQEITTLAAGTTGKGYCRVGGVAAGPIVALTQQEPASFAATSATAVDLVPLLAVFDPARPRHAPATGDHTHDYAPTGHTHTVADDVRDAGRWEVWLDDGSPPQPLLTPDGTDWVYVWVEG